MSKAMYQGDPEELHKIAKDPAKKSVNTFVNPGTPESPLVSENDRKTGHISGKADSKLREHAVPKG